VAKVLLVDTNFSSAPIYRVLVADGHEVHVVGGNPLDCLAKSAARYWQLDYSDTGALSTLVDEEAFEFLVPGCTDRSYASCMEAGRGRFPGFDDADAASFISHKARFRSLAAELGLPVPMTHAAEAIAHSQPVIVKPVDAFSGKGITVLRDANMSSVAAAIEHARAVSASGECLVEDYVEGQLYSHSAFLAGQRVVHDFLVQEDGTANQFVVDTSRVLDSARFQPLLEDLRRWIETLARHLQLVDGLLHTQFIHDGRQTWLIELTRRCPGDLYSQLIELSTGCPYARCFALPFLAQVPEPRAERGLRPIMRHTITVKQEQGLDHVHFLRNLNIERYVPLSLVGDPLLPSPLSRVGILFCSERDQRALDDLYRVTLRRGLVAVSDGTRSHD
jgi:hypothetical protein